MTAPQKIVVHDLTVIRVEDGRIICSGVFETADKRGTHSVLSPTLHFDEVAHANDFRVGDRVVKYEDGSYEHLPKP